MRAQAFQIQNLEPLPFHGTNDVTDPGQFAIRENVLVHETGQRVRRQPASLVIPWLRNRPPGWSKRRTTEVRREVSNTDVLEHPDAGDTVIPFIPCRSR